MSILKKNWYWILFALIIIGGIGVILSKQLKDDTEPITVYKQPSEETLQNIRDKIAAQKGQEVDDKNKPPGASPDGHWHNGEWHDESHSPVEEQIPRKLSKEEIAKLYTKEELAHWESHGLKPPPPGYTYIWNDLGAKLVKYNVPYFEVTETYGYNNYYQLSNNEWDRYKALSAIANKSLDRVIISDDVASLAKKWLQPIHQKTWGPQKAIVTSVTYNREETPEDVAYNQKLTNEKLAAISKPEVDYNINHDTIDLIILELQEELQRRGK